MNDDLYMFDDDLFEMYAKEKKRIFVEQHEHGPYCVQKRKHIHKVEIIRIWLMIPLIYQQLLGLDMSNYTRTNISLYWILFAY